MHHLPNELKDEWLLGRQLEKGGQGIAFLCNKIHTEKKAHNEQAVLKILKGNTEYDLVRMKREIQVLNEINHPNVIKPIHWDRSEFPKWYLMPYGQPLKDKWRDIRKQHENDSIKIFTESVRIIRDLLSGLSQLHACNYVHRDIKPANIIFSTSGEALLIDLGIVFHPEFESITSEKGAGNKFVLISASVEASPYIDCLSIASLWSWLLAKDQTISYGHYHWKYIDLLGDDWRYEIVRATLANCSNDHSSPKNASQMLHLLDGQFKLNQIMHINNSYESAIDEALIAQVNAITQTELDRSERRDRLEASAEIARKPLIILNEILKSNIGKFKEKGIMVSFQYSPEMATNNAQFLLNDELLRLLNSPARTDQLLFSIEGGVNSNRGYRACLFISLIDQPSEDEIGFNIRWKIDSRRYNSSSSMEQLFSISRQLSFKMLSNAPKSEYQPDELGDLFLNTILSYHRHL